MSSYGHNFGFRRSGEDAAVREGRFRCPDTLTDLRQGELIEVDPANPGFIKRAASGVEIIPGFTGLAIQHDGWIQGFYEPTERDTHDMGKVKPGLLTIWSGAGVKIWLQNTAEDTTRPGRTIPARTVVEATGLAIGDNLAWDGSKFIKAAVDGTVVAKVTATDGVGYAEAILVA